MTFFLPLGGREPTFKNSTLILPMISLANVAQLACDLLILRLEMLQIGSISAQFHVPVIGAVDGTSRVTNGISTPIDGEEAFDHMEFQILTSLLCPQSFRRLTAHSL